MWIAVASSVELLVQVPSTIRAELLDAKSGVHPLNRRIEDAHLLRCCRASACTKREGENDSFAIPEFAHTTIRVARDGKNSRSRRKLRRLGV
jgi:hypothetical protein